MFEYNVAKVLNSCFQNTAMIFHTWFIHHIKTEVLPIIGTWNSNLEGLANRFQSDYAGH